MAFSEPTSLEQRPTVLRKEEVVIQQLNTIQVSPEDRNEEGKLLVFPNGPVSELSEREWKIVRTPGFKEWFSESVVLSENGEPMIMYHGSKAPERFAEFKTEYDVAEQVGATSSRFKVQSFITKGSHFTSNKKYIEELLGEGKNVYRVFLSIKNPKVTDHNVTTDKLSKEAVELLQQQGIDGFKTPEGGGVTFVAFEPDQIFIISEELND